MPSLRPQAGMRDAAASFGSAGMLSIYRLRVAYE